MAETKFTYDEIAYPSFLHPQTHPDRLAVMATFLGMKPKSVENCRVLELGCGNGSNLVSFAYALPKSEFVGVDLSKNQIAHGDLVAQNVGLKNLRLIHGDIMEINRADYGEFDYIIAHGLYSWIPEFVREKILAICGELLGEQGIAYISYNAFPGCHLRQMMRGMMLYHTSNIESATEKVKESLGLLNMLGEFVTDDKIYKQILKSEFQQSAEKPPQLIFHDDLAEINQPFYFHEFMAAAEKHDLQFLTEANYFTSNDGNYSPRVLEVLEQFGDDIIKREQYIDFLVNRRFRQTLLCRKKIKVNYKPNPEAMRDVRIASELTFAASKPDFAPNKIEAVLGKNNRKIQIDHSLTKAALFLLGQTFPHSVAFSELVVSAENLLKRKIGEDFTTNEKDETILAGILLQIFGSDLIGIYLHEPEFVARPGERPMVSPIARLRARNNDLVATLRQSTIGIQDDVIRNLLILLDGTRTRQSVTREIKLRIENGKIKYEFDSNAEKRAFLKNLPVIIEENLQAMAKLALFVK
ncbi:MAG: methyltransferase regulatory domain-containing protein [Pyrinomonadaceae bacterium]